MKEENKFKVGDQVIRSQGYGNEHLGVVTKVTASGRATVQFRGFEETYNPNGRIRGSSSSFGVATIRRATPEATERVLKQYYFDQIRYHFDRLGKAEDMLLEDLQTIYDIIKKPTVKTHELSL